MRLVIEIVVKSTVTRNFVTRKKSQLFLEFVGKGDGSGLEVVVWIVILFLFM